MRQARSTAPRRTTHTLALLCLLLSAACAGTANDSADNNPAEDVAAADSSEQPDAATQPDVATQPDTSPQPDVAPADITAPDSAAPDSEDTEPDTEAPTDAETDAVTDTDTEADTETDTATLPDTPSATDAATDTDTDTDTDTETDTVTDAETDTDTETDTAAPPPPPTHCTLTTPLTFGQTWPAAPSTPQTPPGTGCALPGWPGTPGSVAPSFSELPTDAAVGAPGIVSRCLVVEDLNSDGLDDLAYITPAAQWTDPNLLHIHHQKPGGGFSSKTIELKNTDKVYGCTTADLMSNGNIGIVIANELGLTLASPSWGGDWIVFAPSTDVSFDHPVLAVASGDFNRDGKTDLVTAAAVEPEWAKPFGDCTCGPAPDLPYTKCEGGFCTAWKVEYRVHLRQGGGYVSGQALTPMVGEPWSLSVHDLDRDGWPDIFVGAEWGAHGWYRNDGDNTYSLVSTSIGMRPWAHLMGAAVEDFDLDGRFDIFAVDYGVDTLYRAVADDKPYQNASDAAGLFKHWQTAVTWSATAADLDSDGWLDVFAANSAAMTLGSFWTTINPMNPPFQNIPEAGHQVWHNQGGTFAAGVVPLPKGLNAMVMPARASAGDLDADGDVDIALVEWDGTLRLLRNDTPQGGQLRVRLKQGKEGAPRLDGAWVEVWAEGHVQTRYTTPSRGHNTGPAAALVFGLGSVAQVDVVRVTWADGNKTEVWGVQAGATLVLEAPQPAPAP